MPQKNNQGGSGERGFAAMPDEKQREIARKGGEAVSEDREHMAEIGRKGGEACGDNDDDSQGGSKRGFAAMDDEKQREIARKGGQAPGGGSR